MTPEGKVKKMVDSFMKEHFPEAWKYNPPGGAFGKVGVPDKLFLYNGVMIAIETKAEGKDPTTLQKKNLLQLQQQGAIAVVVRGMDYDKMKRVKSAIEAELAKRGKSE